MPDAAYFRAWRAAHPEYLERERARSRARKRTPEQRRAERARARERAAKAKKQQRTRKQQNREKQRRYRQRHRERALASQKKWRDANRARRNAYHSDYVPRWRARNRIDRAREIVGEFISPDRREALGDDLFEEAVAECLLYLGRPCWSKRYAEKQARLAVKALIKQEREHRWYGRYEVNPDLM